MQSERGALMLAAIACFSAAFLLAPSGASSQSGADRAVLTTHSTLPVPPVLAAVMPDGDAFAPRADLDDEKPAPAAVAAPLAVRPPMIVAPTPAPPPARVTAIATGNAPTAVVELAGVPRIVTRGDLLDGSRVAAITDGAVVLADGRRLVLAPAGSAP